MRRRGGSYLPAAPLATAVICTPPPQPPRSHEGVAHRRPSPADCLRRSFAPASACPKLLFFVLRAPPGGRRPSRALGRVAASSGTPRPLPPEALLHHRSSGSLGHIPCEPAGNIGC